MVSGPHHGNCSDDADRHISNVNAAAWSPDGASIVTASTGGTAIVWDAATGRQLQKMDIGTNPAVAWSPDSKRIVTTGPDKSVLIWDAATGAKLMTLTGHLSMVNAAAWSPDGRYIVTTSVGGTMIVWDAATGRQLVGKFLPTNAVAWSPDR